MSEPYCARCGSTHAADAHCGRDSALIVHMMHGARFGGMSECDPPDQVKPV